MGKRIKYPLWDAKTLTIVLLLVFVLSTGLVFFLGHRSVFVELQITLAVISFCLFNFLSVGLYKGIRIKKDKFSDSKFEALDVMDVSSGLDVPSIGDLEFPDTGDDLVGIIISIVLWILVSVVLVTILFFLANFVWAVLLVLVFIIYWVFYRALRQAFIKSRICKGNIIKSMGYGFIYTVLYTGWIFGVIWISNYLLF